jgi:hypothetical protein
MQIEVYPEHKFGAKDSLYYVEFSNLDGKWRLFKRQFLSKGTPNHQINNNWHPETQKLYAQMLDNNTQIEVHPWQLHCGTVNTNEGVVDMNTKDFLKFMVDALNAACAKN